MPEKPWRPHVVRQGEYLSKLALLFGFSIDDVWNHKKNADLKKLRSDRAMLNPGDILWIPNEPPKAISVKLGGTNSFQATVPKVKLSLTLIDTDQKPLSGKVSRFTA